MASFESGALIRRRGGTASSTSKRDYAKGLASLAAMLVSFGDIASLAGPGWVPWVPSSSKDSWLNGAAMHMSLTDPYRPISEIASLPLPSGDRRCLDGLIHVIRAGCARWLYNGGRVGWSARCVRVELQLRGAKSFRTDI